MTAGRDEERRPAEPTFADVLNGFSFDSGRPVKRRRWGRRRGEQARGDDTVDPLGDGSAADRDDLRDDLATETDPADEPSPYARPSGAHGLGRADTARAAEPAAPAPDRTAKKPAHGLTTPDVAGDVELSSAAVRPYAWTRGRTRSGLDLQIETLVSTSSRGRDQLALLQFEHRSVADLCERAHSVAEVAALLSVPLGVAKVLLGDMAGLGLVVVHRSSGSNGDTPDLALMERVLSGLRRL
jgi:hypothetical protein